MDEVKGSNPLCSTNNAYESLIGTFSFVCTQPVSLHSDKYHIIFYLILQILLVYTACVMSINNPSFSKSVWRSRGTIGFGMLAHTGYKQLLGRI